MPAAEDTLPEVPDSGSLPPLNEDIHQVNISDEMENAYLNYSMSVLIGRALPDARDGFKPVHRRVLYAMWRLGNRHDAPHKKSARVVGDVIGKYHPHGDASVYDTIVRMAQPFSLRYTLVDGHGNFGTIDRDPAAAMRYTEVRLSRIAEEMLTDIDRDTVDMVPNFDGTEKEPSVLPTRFPQLLVNGSQGIAVGMATNIPTHNLSETVDACLFALHHPEASVEDLIRFMPAPDFPTGGIIFGLSGVRQAYRTGRGSMMLRAKTHEETDAKGYTSIVVDELPYMVNKAELIKKIALLRSQKKIEGITDLRDESSKQIRIVIELRRDAHAEAVKNNLFKLTELQTTFGINMVALLDGRPQQLNLKQLVNAFIGLRREVVVRRTRFLLQKARADGHLQEGLAVALANIDEFIEIIRSSRDRAEATERLMGRGWGAGVVQTMIGALGGDYRNYRPEEVDPEDCGLHEDGLYWLSRVQTERILDMRLQTLTATQQESIVASYRELCEQITDYLDILARDERVVKIIADDLLYIKEKYGDLRRSEIDPSGDPDFDELDLIPKQDVVVTLSRDGYMKSQLLSDYQAQKRGGQGRNSGKLRDQDAGDQLIVASTHDQILCFTNLGRFYLISHAYMVPSGSAGSKGRPIQNLIPLQQYETENEQGEKEKQLEKVTNILSIPTPDENHCVFFSTARAPVKNQLLRLNRDEVRLEELSESVRSELRRSTEAEAAEFAAVEDLRWAQTSLSSLPAGVQQELKASLKWDDPDTDEVSSLRKKKTWSEVLIQDLTEAQRSEARALFARALETLAAKNVQEWDVVVLGDLPEKARNKAREAFRFSLLSEFAQTHYIFFATARGVVKKVPVSEFSKVLAGGTAAIALDKGDVLIGADLTDGKHSVMLFSDAGKSVRFDEADVRAMGRTARGVGGMKIEPDQRIIAMLVAGDDAEDSRMVLTVCENGFGKRTPLAEYTRHGRNTKGMIAIATSERNGRVVGACLVEESGEVILLSEKGKLVRTPVAGIRVSSRAAQGVTLISLKDDRLVSVTPVRDAGGEVPAEETAASPDGQAQEAASSEDSSEE